MTWQGIVATGSRVPVESCVAAAAAAHAVTVPGERPELHALKASVLPPESACVLFPRDGILGLGI